MRLCLCNSAVHATNLAPFADMHFFIFLHVRCRGPGGVGRGSWPTKTPLPNPVKTYLPVSALCPSAGSWGIQSSSFSSPFHFVLCHSWCLAQRGHDPYPHGSFHLVLGMPFRRSGIHGTKIFISFVVIITITTFIIFTISSSCSTRLGQNCTGNVAIQAVLPWSSLSAKYAGAKAFLC